METVKLLDYTEKPLYQNLRDILLQGLKAIGSKDDGNLDLRAVENGGLKAKAVPKVNLVNWASCDYNQTNVNFQEGKTITQ
jgi:hypothetical protein